MEFESKEVETGVFFDDVLEKCEKLATGGTLEVNDRVDIVKNIAGVQF